MLQELNSVGSRFEYDLTAQPLSNEDEESGGSRLVAAYTIQDPDYRLPDISEDQQHSFDESKANIHNEGIFGDVFC